MKNIFKSGFRGQGSEVRGNTKILRPRTTNLVPVLILSLLLSHVAYAVGVTSGTVITNPTANLSMTYQVTVGTSFNAPAPTTPLSSTVQAVYGLTKVSEVTFNITNAAVSTNYFTVTLNNLSNNPSTAFKANKNGNFTTVLGNPGTLANWRIAFENNTLSGILNDANFKFRAQIKPAANARSASRAQILTEYSLNGVIGDAYVGYDEINYGGANTVNATLLTQVNGPDMVVKHRTKAVKAPASYSGASTDSVPGALVTYNIVLRNEGTATANTVTIVDKIPSNTSFGGSLGNRHGGGATITVQCSTTVSPPYTWGSCTNYSFPGNNSVTALKFDAGTVTVNSYVTLNYAVVIR